MGQVNSEISQLPDEKRDELERFAHIMAVGATRRRPLIDIDGNGQTENDAEEVQGGDDA